MTLDQGQWMTLTFDIHIGSCTRLVNCIHQLWHHRRNSFWKIHCFAFFPYKSIREQIWHCRKISQGQPRVIIWTKLVVLEHPMLHTKFKGHRPFGSREEDFLRFIPYMGMATILGHVTWTVWTNFRSPFRWRLHMKFDFDWPSGFWGEDV